jgi:hypothetical protein
MAHRGDKDTPTRRFQDGSVSGTEYTLGPMAGGYLRVDHES